MNMPDPVPNCTKCNKPLPEGTHHFLVRGNGAECIQVRIAIFKVGGKYVARAEVDQ